MECSGRQRRVLCYYFENDTMTTDAANAFEKLGVDVQHVVPAQSQAGETVFDPVSLLKEVLCFQPDFVFLLNTFGIDPECHLLRSLSLTGTKTAMWFIDNPFYYYDHLIKLKDLKNCFSFAMRSLLCMKGGLWELLFREAVRWRPSV